MRITLEGDVTSRSINKKGEVVCSVEVHDMRYPLDVPNCDTIHLKTALLELGQKVQVTIDDGF